jgi:hypothetical protein
MKSCARRLCWRGAIMRQQMDVESLRSLMDREHRHLRDEIDAERRIIKQRFKAGDRALTLSAQELSRRLDTLNHAHEQAREKERDFIRRESFDTFVQRVSDDLGLFRRDSQSAANVATAAREAARKAVADEMAEQNTSNEKRFGRIEGVHAKIFGGLALGTFILPLITGLVIYVLTKNP